MCVYRTSRTAPYRYDFQFKGKRYTGTTGLLQKRLAEIFERRIMERLREEAAGLGAKDLSVPVPHPSRKRGDTFIYFARCGDAVKIGMADRPRRRMCELQTGNPTRIELLAVVRGAPRLETALHRRFRAEHIHGEWFRCSAGLLAFISDARRRGRSEEWVNEILGLTNHLFGKTAGPDNANHPTPQ